MAVVSASADIKLGSLVNRLGRYWGVPPVVRLIGTPETHDRGHCVREWHVWHPRRHANKSELLPDYVIDKKGKVHKNEDA